MKAGAKGTVKSTEKAVKTAEKTSKAAIKTAEATAKATQKAAEATAKAAQKAAEIARQTAILAYKAAVAAAKAIAAAVKAIIAAVEKLIAAIAAGGWVAVVVVVVICLVALIVGSCFGIFFSSEDKNDGSQTMREVVVEINQDYQNQLAHLRIRDDLEIEECDIEAIAKVCGPDATDKDFNEYVSVVIKLQKRLCKVKTSINTKDKGVVNECLLALQECFTNQYMRTLSDIESKKSLILSEFLSRLEQEYETVVRKYSMTTAATCQTSLNLKDKSQVFDLVVIDEAARANPLDLFIPMSMGKKIVLVGDHKQLPHMLEPDVLKMITDDPKFKDLPEIEKSLFERLFGMFSKRIRDNDTSLWGWRSTRQR